MKIICVGWNYGSHNAELYKEEKKEPVLFLKPETSLLRENKPFYLPDFSQQIEHEAELVVRIGKMGKNIAPKFADRYIDAITIGVDFTARDLQAAAKKAGAPWDISKGFDNSAPVGEFVDKSKFPDLQNVNFSLTKNGNTVQSGNSSEMITPIAEIVALASKYFTLKTGDLIFTGTPSGVGKVEIGDELKGFIEGQELLSFCVK
ncbi:MAG: fumarylacetoacetate hydrolase family protein [Paludibacteraceae bacterium]|nr:fumarylacetoacetate hydrolase family protein [Paludibacteraceae bacterium]